MKTFADFLNESDARIEIEREKFINAVLAKRATPVNSLDREFYISFFNTYILGADPTAKKIYLQWLARQSHPGGYRSTAFTEDTIQIRNALAVFDKFKHRLADPRQRDINSYKHYKDLYPVILPFEGEKTNNELKREEIAKWKGSIKTIYDGPLGKILVPTTEESSCFLGRGTKWCTAATSGKNHFNDYNNSGPLYVLITPKGKKYQVHFETMQMMDDMDRGAAELIKKLPVFSALVSVAQQEYITPLRQQNVTEKDVAKARRFISSVGYTEVSKQALKDLFNRLVQSKAPVKNKDELSLLWFKLPDILASDNILSKTVTEGLLQNRLLWLIDHDWLSEYLSMFPQGGIVVSRFPLVPAALDRYQQRQWQKTQGKNDSEKLRNLRAECPRIFDGSMKLSDFLLNITSNAGASNLAAWMDSLTIEVLPDFHSRSGAVGEFIKWAFKGNVYHIAFELKPNSSMTHNPHSFPMVYSKLTKSNQDTLRRKMRKCVQPVIDVIKKHEGNVYIDNLGNLTNYFPIPVKEFAPEIMRYLSERYHFANRRGTALGAREWEAYAQTHNIRTWDTHSGMITIMMKEIIGNISNFSRGA